MDHSEAVKRVAAEKYLLGELAANERDSFEEHYFSCAECAADLKSAAILLDNARELMRAVPEPQPASASAERRSSWLAWLRPWPVPVLALLVLVIAYQNFITIPGMRHQSTIAPQALATFSLVTAQSRGESEITIAVQKNIPFGLYFDIPARSDFGSYTCDVISDSGKRLFSVNVPAAQARDSVQLLIPGDTLASGRYHLAVLGNRGPQAAATPGEEVARLPFAVQIK